MTLTPTHEAVCTDDGTRILLRHDRAAGTCASCGFNRGRYLVLADGGPGHICAPCMAELDWVIVRRFSLKERFNLWLLARAARVTPARMWDELGR